MLGVPTPDPGGAASIIPVLALTIVFVAAAAYFLCHPHTRRRIDQLTARHMPATGKPTAAVDEDQNLSPEERERRGVDLSIFKEDRNP